MPAEFIPDSYRSVNKNVPFLDWLYYMLDLTGILLMISTSYGGNEQTFPVDYVKSVCNQLGARGVSVIFSSGNNGVG